METSNSYPNSILLQENWYFDCQLGNLTMVCDSLTGVGKDVDAGDPILPMQMPRGYGGVAVLWKKSSDLLINGIPDGANRIQCIEVQAQQPILIVSSYMQCKGLRDNVDEFEDNLAQLHEVIQKYKNSHYIPLVCVVGWGAWAAGVGGRWGGWGMLQ